MSKRSLEAKRARAAMQPRNRCPACRGRTASKAECNRCKRKQHRATVVVPALLAKRVAHDEKMRLQGLGGEA